MKTVRMVSSLAGIIVGVVIFASTYLPRNSLRPYQGETKLVAGALIVMCLGFFILAARERRV